MDQGNVLVVKNEYGNYEFFEFGEWLTYNYNGQLSSKMIFDLKLGRISEKAWNYYIDSASILCDNYRILEGDSLIEYQKWYYPNGVLEQEVKYLIERQTNKKKRHIEKRTLLDKKKYSNDEGEQLKKKYLKGK